MLSKKNAKGKIGAYSKHHVLFLLKNICNIPVIIYTSFPK